MGNTLKYSKETEAELLLRLQTGDEEAFTCLFYAFKDKLYGFLFDITKSEAKTKDLVQDVFLKIWQNRNSIAEINNFNAYIFYIAQNQAIDHFRKSSKELFSGMDSLAFEEDKLNPDPSITLINKEIREKIDEAVNQLPPQQKKIFVLHNEYGFKHHEIAEQLNLSVSTIQNHMREALRNLRTYLAHANLIILVHLIIRSIYSLF